VITLTATEARRTLFDLIKRANQTHDVVRVQHKSGDAVIKSSEDYESLQETLSLLSQPEFKDAFNESKREIQNGELLSFEDVFKEPQ
jgi:antitoxin YefM